jgi:nitrite reductase/ring-hydroxylating ferredoxin subunit
MSPDVRVCRVDELPPGQRLLFRHRDTEIGVFNHRGRFYAVRNRCAHAGAPLCAGRVGGLVEADRPHAVSYRPDTAIVSCPWHHWEFRLDDGTCLSDAKARVRTYAVTVIDGYVTLAM